MPKFTLSSDHPAVDLFQPAGGIDSFTVEPGQPVEVPGDLVGFVADPEFPSEDDAYIVANNGVESAWPKAVWSLVEDKPAKSAPVKEN